LKLPRSPQPIRPTSRPTSSCATGRRCIRLATHTDLRLLEDYFIGLSDESRRLRFWTPSVDITEQSKRAVEVDNVNHMTLLAVGGVDTERMLGGAQFYREGLTPGECRCRRRVPGPWPGVVLLGMLAQAVARSASTFFAEVLREPPDDRGGLPGFGCPRSCQAGHGRGQFPTVMTDDARPVRTASASRRRTPSDLPRAKSVAVIGASRQPDSIGGRLFRTYHATVRWRGLSCEPHHLSCRA
jgi:hypothetical protein